MSILTFLFPKLRKNYKKVNINEVFGFVFNNTPQFKKYSSYRKIVDKKGKCVKFHNGDSIAINDLLTLYENCTEEFNELKKNIKPNAIFKIKDTITFITIVELKDDIVFYKHCCYEHQIIWKKSVFNFLLLFEYQGEIK